MADNGPPEWKTLQQNGDIALEDGSSHTHGHGGQTQLPLTVIRNEADNGYAHNARMCMGSLMLLPHDCRGGSHFVTTNNRGTIRAAVLPTYHPGGESTSNPGVTGVGKCAEQQWYERATKLNDNDGGDEPGARFQQGNAEFMSIEFELTPCHDCSRSLRGFAQHHQRRVLFFGYSPATFEEERWFKSFASRCASWFATDACAYDPAALDFDAPDGAEARENMGHIQVRPLYEFSANGDLCLGGFVLCEHPDHNGNSVTSCLHLLEFDHLSRAMRGVDAPVESIHR